MEIRGKKYIDGGVSNNCPVDAAIKWGAKEVWVVELGGYAVWDKVIFGGLDKFVHLWPGPQSYSLRLLQKVFSPNPPVTQTATIRTIAPSKDLGLGSLSYTQKRFFNAMQLGKKDAQNFLTLLS